MKRENAAQAAQEFDSGRLKECREWCWYGDPINTAADGSECELLERDQRSPRRVAARTSAVALELWRSHRTERFCGTESLFPFLRMMAREQDDQLSTGEKT